MSHKINILKSASTHKVISRLTGVAEFEGSYSQCRSYLRGKCDLSILEIAAPIWDKDGNYMAIESVWFNQLFNQFYMRLLILSLVLLLAASCTRSLPQPRYYNAYSPLYDEFFVVGSYRDLQPNDVIWFDDNTQEVNYTTPYVATIISPYKSNWDESQDIK